MDCIVALVIDLVDEAMELWPHDLLHGPKEKQLTWP